MRVFDDKSLSFVWKGLYLLVLCRGPVIQYSTRILDLPLAGCKDTVVLCRTPGARWKGSLTHSRLPPKKPLASMVSSPSGIAYSCTLVYDCLILCNCFQLMLEASKILCCSKRERTILIEYCRRVRADGPFAAHQGLPEHSAAVPDWSNIHGRALQLPPQPCGPQDCASHGCRVRCLPRYSALALKC